MLRDSPANAPVNVWRRATFARVIACTLGAMVAPGASADSPTTPNPEELWRAFPLEQKPTGGVDTSASPPSRRSSARPPSSRAHENPAPGTGSSWIAILAVAVGGAVLVLTVLLGRNRVSSRRGVGPTGNDEVGAKDSRRQPVTAGAVPQELDGRAVAGRAGPRPTPAAAPQQHVASASGHVPAEPVAVPGRRFERGATSAMRAAGASARGRNEPVCQIRWLPGRGGSSFYAAMTDTDGIERALAWSPRFGWRGPSPPEQRAEAEAALRKLAKKLRASGWRPLRAKGEDFDEQRWYARRFRQPAAETEGDNEVRARVGPGEVAEAGGEHAGASRSP